MKEERGVTVAKRIACALHLRCVFAAGDYSGYYEVQTAGSARNWGNPYRAVHIGCRELDRDVYRGQPSNQSADDRRIRRSRDPRCHAAPFAESDL